MMTPATASTIFIGWSDSGRKLKMASAPLAMEREMVST